ncbi:ADP-ribosylglycohydrolase [Paramixta manurensis]|uniref:ADP-ribosylglycohydrolase n=1 Tax=Paramixta manurensis TaxID=2740817 RepID=A0A6M8U7V8_9GAMM|nr:ADP-ribosylglycohydrolase [Erwiniaceae bacterium PD-1]
MIDLHTDDSIINRYAERYHHLLPVSTRKQQRSIDGNENEIPSFRWDASVLQINAKEDALNKAKGSFLGLAVGDAIGTTLEFTERDSHHVSDMVGGGPFRLKAGEWTDDTSMAICLAEACLESGRMDVTSFRKKLVEWYKKGVNSVNGRCFDIGMTTRYALEQYLLHGESWFGNTEKSTAGNAGIIRQSPVVIFNWRSLERIYFDTKAQSMATHCAAESISSCNYLGLLLHMLINGYSKNDTFSPHVFPSTARVLIINAGEYKEKKRNEIRSSGYVIDTLEAAIWAVWNTNNFRDAILLAANLGDDADSVAATAGQLAGALYGMSGIPEEWLNKLAEKERLELLANKLFVQGENRI